MKTLLNMKKILILLMAALSLITSAFGGALTYSVAALPNIQGVTRPFVLGINNQGTVIGLSDRLGATTNISFMYSHGRYTFIEPSDTSSNDVQALNNFNSIIGVVNNGQKYVGFLYNQGKVVTIQPVADALETDLWSINDLGQITGVFSPAGIPQNTNDHVFIRQVNGTYTDLGSFGFSYPYALINNQGTVVLTTVQTNPDGSYLEITYLRQPGNSQLQRLPSLVPGGGVDMQSINQFGVVAGAAYVDTVNNMEHAFLYANGKISDLGVLPATGVNPGGRFSWFNCVNIWGIAVGLAGQEYTSQVDPSNPQKVIPNAGYNHGIVCYNGVIHDLNSLLSAKDKGWVIGEAMYLNDLGQIAALASYNGGEETSVILTPNEGGSYLQTLSFQ
jgi:probable HAF family extracellular repeat protein